MKTLSTSVQNVDLVDSSLGWQQAADFVAGVFNAKIQEIENQHQADETIEDLEFRESRIRRLQHEFSALMKKLYTEKTSIRIKGNLFIEAI